MAKSQKSRQRATATRGAPPVAPAELSPAAAAWVATIEADYRLEDHQRQVLLEAARAWDRAQQARALIARDGLTYVAKSRIYSHPRRADREARERAVRKAHG